MSGDWARRACWIWPRGTQAQNQVKDGAQSEGGAHAKGGAAVRSETKAELSPATGERPRASK